MPCSQDAPATRVVRSPSPAFDQTAATAQPDRAKSRQERKPCRGAAAAASAESLSDEALLVRYRDAGDSADFDALVRRYERPLCRYLERYLADRMLAEDVLQNTLLLVHRRCGSYHEGRPVRAWLYTIATRQAIDAVRRRRRFAAISLDQPALEEGDRVHELVNRFANETPEPLAALQREETRQWVRKTVAALPERFRRVLGEAYFHGRPHREIAELLEIPEGTVKSRLHLAIARMQKKAHAAHLSEAG